MEYILKHVPKFFYNWFQYIRYRSRTKYLLIRSDTRERSKIYFKALLKERCFLQDKHHFILAFTILYIISTQIFSRQNVSYLEYLGQLFKLRITTATIYLKRLQGCITSAYREMPLIQTTVRSEFPHFTLTLEFNKTVACD